jgi:hypothetical protein
MFKRQHKYLAKRTEVDGHKFHSIKEAHRFEELRLLERAGEIYSLQLQPVFELETVSGVNGEVHLVGRYRGDFAYIEKNSTVLVVEDVKGYDTPLSKWKRKHVEAQYGIEIKLT